jgi:hypothetical protein
VGDAVLFGYDGANFAQHVAIVVRVRSDGNIVSIGGNEHHNTTSEGEVVRDKYSGAIGDSSYWGMKISGYVSPVEDDMPYTENEIRELVKEGVGKELSTALGASGITPMQGAEAAVSAQEAISGTNGIAHQLAELKLLVQGLAPPQTTPQVPPTGNTSAGAAITPSPS